MMQLLWKGPVQGGRCHAMAPSLLRMARKRRGRWGKPGSPALSGHPSGWGPWRSYQGCVRAPGELNPEVSMSTWAGARAGGAEWGPLASKTSWGRAEAAVAVSNAWKVARRGAGKPCHQCALHPHCVVWSQSKCPCRV